MRAKGAYNEYAVAAFIRASQVKRLEDGLPMAVRADLAAVDAALGLLDEKTANAVRAVYVPDRGSCNVSRHVLHKRVIAHSTAVYYSQETIYRALAKARRVFAECRGLTIE